MSKAYFIGGAYMGCWYVRCLLPMLANGWLGIYRGLNKSVKPPHQIREESMLADIIVFHRANSVEHHKTAIEYKKLGKKIVFDNDDTFKIDETHAFFNVDDAGFTENKNYLNNVTNNFIRNCDLVTCSTEFLAKEYRELNPNVIVLPNCVNPDDWDTPLRNKGKKIRIGVVGSTAYYHDFDIIKPVLQELHDRDDVQLVMFGLHSKERRQNNPKIEEVHKREYDFWDKLTKLELVGWKEMTEYFTTLNELRLDILLIPRRESYFNRAKSNIKFLEASMLEIPCIVSRFSGDPYENDIDGTNGRYVKTNDKDDWLKEINLLINDKKLRREMGKKAKDYVLKNYNINDKFGLWEEAYKTICD